MILCIKRSFWLHALLRWLLFETVWWLFLLILILILLHHKCTRDYLALFSILILILLSELLHVLRWFISLHGLTLSRTSEGLVLIIDALLSHRWGNGYRSIWTWLNPKSCSWSHALIIAHTSSSHGQWIHLSIWFIRPHQQRASHVLFLIHSIKICIVVLLIHFGVWNIRVCILIRLQTFGIVHSFFQILNVLFVFHLWSELLLDTSHSVFSSHYEFILLLKLVEDAEGDAEGV